MALGLLMCGRHSLPWNKVGIDLAFEGAWRSWQYRSRFSQVNIDIAHGSDGVWVMTRADERKHTTNFFWDTSGREIAIYARPIWVDEDVDPDEAAGLIDGDVPGEGWRELAADFLRRFER